MGERLLAFVREVLRQRELLEDAMERDDVAMALMREDEIGRRKRQQGTGRRRIWTRRDKRLLDACDENGPECPRTRRILERLWPERGEGPHAPLLREALDEARCDGTFSHLAPILEALAQAHTDFFKHAAEIADGQMGANIRFPYSDVKDAHDKAVNRAMPFLPPDAVRFDEQYSWDSRHESPILCRDLRQPVRRGDRTVSYRVQFDARENDRVMANPMRVALAANLTRAANTFDALAKRANGPEPATRTEQLEETQAAIDAGAAVWEGVIRGLVNVPAIARLVGELAGQGHMKPETTEFGNVCANFFHDVMREFLYPEGEGVFPYFAFREEAQQAHHTGSDVAGGLSALWRRHELQEQATGCTMLARLVESGVDEQYRNKTSFTKLFSGLADALEAYTVYVQQKGKTGSVHELSIFEHIYQIRCYYSGNLPNELDSLWNSFVDATTPYEELPTVAAKVADSMLTWIRNNTGQVETIVQPERTLGQPTANQGALRNAIGLASLARNNGDCPHLAHEDCKKTVRNHVFISYSHKDQRWLNDLQTHLKPFCRDGSVTYWSDQQIATGSNWFLQIQDALSQTSVAVLLVTPDFLASDFIHDHELAPILKEAERGGVRVVWIPVRACAFERTSLKDYQAVIDPKTPLATMKANRDEAWVKICQEIEKAAKHN